MTASMVRLATTADAAAIMRIYNQGIEDRVATFETRPRTVDDIVTALFGHAELYPCMVAQLDGRVAAAAWTMEYRSRECYAGMAEFSVYTDRECRRAGLGTLVMKALIDECSRRGYWKLVSRVFVENQPSRSLLARLGFREVGVYYRHGKLDGEWKDCVILELLLGQARLPEKAGELRHL